MKSASDINPLFSKSLNPVATVKKKTSCDFTTRDDILVSTKSFVTEHKGKFRDNYKIGHIIGTGSYGEVRKCLHNKSGGVRAVKLISKSILQDGLKAGIIKELEILKNLVAFSYRIIQTL